LNICSRPMSTAITGDDTKIVAAAGHTLAVLEAVSSSVTVEDARTLELYFMR